MNEVVSGITVSKAPEQVLVDIENLHDAAWLARNKDTATSLKILSQLEGWVRSSDLRLNKYRAELAEILFTRGKIIFIQGDYYTALNFFSESLSMLNEKENLDEIGRRTKMVGRALAYLQSYSAALSEMFHTLKIAQKLHSSELEGEVLGDIGFTYTSMSEPMKGLSYLQQSYDILEHVDKPVLLANTLDHMCYTYSRIKDYDQALSCGRRAQALFMKNEDYHAQTRVMLKLGNIFMETGRTKDGVKIFRQVIDLTADFPFYQERSIALCKLAEIQIENKIYAKAKEYIDASLFLAKKYHLVMPLVLCHQLLSELYQRQGEYKLAFTHYKKYHSAVEQLHKLEETNRVKLVELSGNIETARKMTGALQVQNDALRKEVKLRKKIQSELEEISRRDSLTGIFNRRYFFEMAEREIKGARRYGYPVSAIMIDLDHFKNINDTYGHLVGDQVLVEVSKRIMENCRSVDIVGRYGGEEFVILLPQTCQEAALATAKRIWEGLTVQPTNTGKLVLQVQASFGVACYKNGSALELDELIDQADQALYRAKGLGRNRIEAYD